MHVLLLLALIIATGIIVCVINDARDAIIKAIGERVDPSRAKQMTDDLRKSGEPLAKAVEDNKPISS